MGCNPSIMSDHDQYSKEQQQKILSNNDALRDVNSALFKDSYQNPVDNKLKYNRIFVKSYDKLDHADNSNTSSAEMGIKKKDSIVIAMLDKSTGITMGHHAINIRRNTGSGISTMSARLGHRKSSLALTPEDEPLDTTTNKLILDAKYPHLLPPNPSIKVLLAFPKNDNVYEAHHNACLRLNFEVTTCRSVSGTTDLFQHATNGNQHLIIVDCRNNKSYDPELMVRSLRNLPGSQYTIIAAVVKESSLEKDDSYILSLLDAGFNRCIIASPQILVCCAELRQIQHSLIRPQNILSTQQVLYTALHQCREPMIITDDLLRTQYANKSAEHFLNMKLSEILGRPFAELLNTDVTPIMMHINRNREFDGSIAIRRKSQETMTIHVKVIPVLCIGHSPTHLVITIDLTTHTEQPIMIPQAKEVPRGSLHSIRRGSFDVRSLASDSLRRTSLAKLSSLPLEAPITKIVTLLSQVQENCSSEESRLLDKVMDFLKREGLYSPQMKEIRTDDPVATDLIGALLLQGPSNNLSSRRSSNDSIIRANRSSSSLTPLLKVSSQISELLQTALEWDFDIFKLETITEKHPLLYIGIELFRRYDIYSTFSIDESTVKSWLIVIERHYHSSNTYHNSSHAADVMQATGAFLQQLAKKESNQLDQINEVSALIAAATHDIDHPGKSSAFLFNSNNPIAILYNDISVLESHHAATTYRLTLADDKVNIFKNLDKENYKITRSIIIDMILATEMTRHFEHLAKFVSVFGADADSKEVTLLADADDNDILIRRMLIKCADVSNPARPLLYCVEWARRIAEEYFLQTDEEKRLNLPIVMPMFDRATCSISKSQIGFIEFIIQDMMKAWDGFIDMPQLMKNIEDNYKQWKLFEQQGIHTLSDIKIKQSALAKK